MGMNDVARLQLISSRTRRTVEKSSSSSAGDLAQLQPGFSRLFANSR